MTNPELLQLLRSEVIPAIGCTEPIAVALCTARAKELLGAEPDSITVHLSKNVYKNALAVGIPNTGMTGLPIAIALGATVGKSEYMLEVLRDATPEAVAYAKAYMLRVPATIKVDYEAPSLLYIHVEVSKEGQTAQATIMDEHTHFVTSPISHSPAANSPQDVQYPIGGTPSNSEASILLPLLQLLAMSIASDIVPITGENRILAYFGLRQMNSDPFVGIKCLMQIANIEPNKLSISDLVYKIGPRINASGRMKSGAEAVQLLITDDIEVAQAKAGEIDSYNAERKDYDSKTTDEALELLKLDPNNDNKYSTVVYAPHWHKGVIGIAASRLIEHHYRPTIVLTNSEDGIISGSARSAGGFDIYSAIDSCRDLLTNFGGHIYAAGLSMHVDNLPAFCERFEHYVATHIREDQLQPTLLVEAELELADITPAFYNVIRYLEPFGPGNPRPLFATRNLINHRDTRVVGKTGEHLRLDVTDRAYAITGIAFGRAEMAQHIQNGNPVDICYELDENTFNNRTTIQMMVQDIKPS